MQPERGRTHGWRVPRSMTVDLCPRTTALNAPGRLGHGRSPLSQWREAVGQTPRRSGASMCRETPPCKRMRAASPTARRRMRFGRFSRQPLMRDLCRAAALPAVPLWLREDEADGLFGEVTSSDEPVVVAQGVARSLAALPSPRRSAARRRGTPTRRAGTWRGARGRARRASGSPRARRRGAVGGAGGRIRHGRPPEADRSAGAGSASAVE